MLDDLEKDLKLMGVNRLTAVVTRDYNIGIPNTGILSDLYSFEILPTASSVVIQAQVASSPGALVSFRTIRRRFVEGHLGSRHPLSVLLVTLTHRRLQLELCRARGNWTAAEWNQVIFSNESRFNLSSDDIRVRVWRPRGERLNPAFDLQ
ncbi:transposable element Tcb2 transposase [Trichonephila clavipes]|nr:transposable element Tcb2 transposase [Trichonephila clavipes]